VQYSGINPYQCISVFPAMHRQPGRSIACGFGRPILFSKLPLQMGELIRRAQLDENGEKLIHVKNPTIDIPKMITINWLSIHLPVWIPVGKI